MPKLYNTVTKKFSWHPDSYIGQFPFILEDEAAAQGIVDAEVVVEEVVETPKPKKKKKAAYKSDAVDGDGDGLVQDGTVFQREAGTELSEEEVAALNESAENEVSE